MEALQLIVFVPSLIVSLTSGCLYPTDVVFLLDGSESVSESSFLQQKAFVVVNTNTLQMMAPSLKQIHVGVEVFSSDVNVITQLDKPTLPDTFSNFVLAAHQPRDGTRTNVALRTLRYMVSQQSRKHSLLRAVLITDGYSKDVAKTIEEARRAKNIGVEFIFIGIGNSIKTEEVAGMVDDYSKVFLLKSFDELAGISDKVRDAICSGVPRIWISDASSKRNLKDGFHKTAVPSDSYRISSAPTTEKVSESITTRALYTTTGRKSILPIRYTTHPVTNSTTGTTTTTKATTSTLSTNTATAISSTTQITTTITTTISTTTTQASSLISSTAITTTTTTTTESTQQTFTLPTTNKRPYTSNHFTLVPLTLLGGFGGSETVMDIFRGSRYYSPKSKTSYGMRIPFPLFMPHVTTSPFKPRRTTLSPYRYLADMKKIFHTTTLKTTQTTPMNASSAPMTVNSRQTVLTTTPATLNAFKKPTTSTTMLTIVTSSTTTTQTVKQKSKSTRTTPTYRLPMSTKMPTSTDSRCLGKSPVDGEPSQYYEKDGPLLHKRSCPVGVAFDRKTCTCILHTPFVTSECRADLVLTFSRGIKDDSGGNTIMSQTNNVKIVDNIAKFSGGHLETWRFINVFRKSITIRFRFFPVSNREPRTQRPLIGNCNPDNRKSYSIELDEVSRTVTFSLATSERVAVRELPYREGWNSVLMIYNGNIFYCQVNDRVHEEVLTGVIQSGDGSLKIGACGSTWRPVFYGEMDDIYVHVCDVPIPPNA